MCTAGIFTEVTHDTHLLLMFPWGGLLFTKQYFPIYPYSFRNKPDEKQGLGSAPIISCCLCITVWLLTCLFCLEWVFKSLLLMLASLLPLLEPGKLLAFHLESEGGLQPLTSLTVLEKKREAWGQWRRRVRSRKKARQDEAIIDSNILTTYLQNANSCANQTRIL